MTFRDVDALVAGGGATAGMIAKLDACRGAIESGVGEVFVADGKDLAGLRACAPRARRRSRKARDRRCRQEHAGSLSGARLGASKADK